MFIGFPDLMCNVPGVLASVPSMRADARASSIFFWYSPPIL